MPLSRTEVNQIVAKMQTSADLSAGGIAALKEVLNGINLGDAPEDGTTYGREDGEWVAISSGGANSTTVIVNFGPDFTDKASATVTGQTWVTANSCIVPQAVVAAGVDPDEMYLLDLKPQISNRVAGVGFTLTVYSQPEARGGYSFMCIGT